MDTSTKPYHIVYWNGDTLSAAEVHPCCSEENVVDYGIYINDQLVFNVTKNEEEGRWVISLKNADREIDDDIVQNIGLEIDQHNNE